MAITTATGYLDLTLGYIAPLNGGTWAATSGTSWDSFTSWVAAPISPLVWVAAPLDTGSIGYWNIKIESTYEGDLQKYEVYSSTTGEFNGEETMYTILEGDENIPAFYGQYFRVAAFVYGTGGQLALTSMIITTSNNKLELTFSEVDTATLPTYDSVISGATPAGARVLALGRKTSYIENIMMSPRYYPPVTYTEADYIVEDYFVSTIDIVQPSWVNKSVSSSTLAGGVGIAIALLNQNGNFITNTLDARVQAYPEQYMAGGQVLTR